MDQKIDLYDINQIWDYGIPRISTLFQKDRNILAYNKGWRIRQEFKKYSILKSNSFWWTSRKQDGQLYNLQNYRKDMVEALGGVDTILKNTLISATGY